MQLHQPAPDFELPDLQGSVHKLSNHLGKIIIINFWSAECPHSERTDVLLLKLLGTWGEEVIVLPIASNQNESVQMVAEAAKTRGIQTVLMDVNRVAADLYEAVATPHVFVIDRKGILRYRGAVDDVKFRQPKATRFYLEEVIEAMLDNRQPDLEETPAYGCAIVREI